MNMRFFIAMMLMVTGLVFVPAAVVLAEDENAIVSDSQEAPQAAVFGMGRTSYAKFVSDTAYLPNSNAAVWANAFSTSITLAAPGCVSLNFSSEATGHGTAPLSFQFRAIIGGAVVNNSGVFFDPAHASTTSGIWSLAAFNWWRCALPAGTHSVLVQFKPYTSGRTASVRNRTLIIEY